MSYRDSPAMQRFNRLLAEQQDFIEFLKQGKTQLEQSIEVFDMQQTTLQQPMAHQDGIVEGRDYQPIKLGNGPYPWHWKGLGDFSSWESDEGSLSREEACHQAQKELITLCLPEFEYTPTANRDFIVYPIYGLFYWKSYGDVFGDDTYQSANGHVLPSAAEADAIATLGAIKDDAINMPVPETFPYIDYSQLIPRPDLCPFKPNSDFVIEQAQDGRCYWEGVEGSPAEEFCSEDGLESERFAVADAIYQLSLLVTGCCHADALTRVYEQSLPIHHLQEPQQ